MATIFYKSLKFYCSTALELYFRKWEVHGTENIPEGPVLFVPNHQNAFLDAILVTCSSKKNPWFLTRANVFNKPAVASLLNKMQMLPIYRIRDGFATLKKNDQVMDKVVQMLNRGQTILIFAEGNHSEHENLGPLQKGVARMAMAADSSANVAIVPVGIRYESRTTFRTDVLVNFGNPIYVKNFGETSDNLQDQMETILKCVRNGLEPLMLHIDSDRYEERVTHLHQNRERHKKLKDQLAGDQKVLASFPQQLYETTSSETRAALRNILMWYVKLNSIIPIIIVRKLLLSNIKDPQFIGSVKFAGGMLIAPVFWGLQAVVIFQLTGSVPLSITYLASILICLKWS